MTGRRDASAIARSREFSLTRALHRIGVPSLLSCALLFGIAVTLASCGVQDRIGLPGTRPMIPDGFTLGRDRADGTVAVIERRQSIPARLRQQRMPARTAVLPRVHRGRSFTTEHILSVRHGFHVSRVHAAAIAAQVIEFECARDGTDQQRERGTMRAAKEHAPDIHAAFAVALPADGTIPLPTLIRSVRERREPVTKAHTLHAATYREVSPGTTQTPKTS